MPNTKISNLTSAGTLTGSEVAPIVQSGNTVKATAQDIANLALPSQTGNANRYLQTNGTTASWDAVNISTADITGTLPIANGGTGQTSANAALNALLPSQTGNANRYLQTNGTNTSWAAVTSGPTLFSASIGLSGGFLTAGIYLINQVTGGPVFFDQAAGQINLLAISSPFTANKTFVSCSSISTSTDVGVFGGATISPNQIDLRFYATGGGAYSFTGKTTLVNVFIKVEIYP